MSFCPHCGKSVAEQAIKCIACGGELQPRGKGARFKGTMMMQPGQAPAATPPAAAPAPTPAPVAKPAPAPAPVQPAPAAAASPSKVAKHTMLGTGLAGMGIAPPPGMGMGIAPPPGASKSTVASVPPGAPPPAAGPSSLPPAAPPPPDPALADTGRTPASEPPPEQDPPRTAPRAQAMRLDQDSDPAPQLVPGRKGGPIVALAIVGVMLLFALGYLIARFLGLVS